jgi:hypothetical protein
VPWTFKVPIWRAIQMGFKLKKRVNAIFIHVGAFMFENHSTKLVYLTVGVDRFENI